MSNEILIRLLGTSPPRGFQGFPDCHSTVALYRAYLWGKHNQQRVSSLSISVVTRELLRRGFQLRSQ